MKELDLFEPVKALLKSMGYNNVYGEVSSIDVIAHKGKEVVAVELKRNLNLKVLEQAIRARKYADYIYVAVPALKHRPDYYRKKLFNELNIGLIYVKGDKATVIIEPNVNKKWLNILRKIEPHHSRTVGGAKSGDTTTAYKETMFQVKQVLKEHGGYVDIDYIYERVTTHYKCKDNKRCLQSSLVKKWNSAWLEVKKEGRKTLFKLKDNGDE